MSMNPLNDLSAVYMQEVLKPQLGKGSAAGPTKKVEKGKTDVESSAKRIRQAVYDIRYRARREDIKLDQAFTQYMGHTTMTGPEKSAVKEKLGIGPGGGSDVKEEMEEKKFKVRVKDKESGSSYVRYATRQKINQLRSNPNISSVEMTGYGEPYEGEKKKGKATAAVTSGKGLAKKDYDGDGKIESGAKEYRGAVHNAIQRKKGGKPDGKDTSNVKEGFSNWREDLFEVMDDVEANKKIKEKKVNNKIVVNPSIKETVEELGGTLIEMVEIDEIDFIVESVYTELLDEGYVEDDIEDAIEYALVEAKVTYGHDTKEPESGGSRLLRAVGRLARQKLKSVKKKATHAVAKAQVSAYNKGREVAQSAAEKGRKAKQGIKSAIGKAARKVADRMSEETEIDEESYMDYAKRKAAERKDTRMTVTAADKKGNTKAYQNYKAGDKRYKAAAGVDEEFEIEEGITEIQEKALSRAQQRFMGMVYAAKKGETPASTEVAKAAAGMSKKAARDFAKTKHAKLPEKKVEEAVTQMPGRETTPPEGTTAKQDDIQKKQVTNAADKQKLTNLKMMQQKQQMLQRQKLNLQKQGKFPLNTEEVEYEIEEGVRPTPVDKPLDKAAFKKRRKSLKGYEQRGDARKRGHEGKEWYNSGRTYSPDEAKSGRAKMDDAERMTRKRSAIDPDDEDLNYSADKTKNPKKLRKQKAMGELGEAILNELRRSEKEGKGSPEMRTKSGHLVGTRGERKRKGEMGGRHFYSGGEGGARTERGKKKGEEGSQQKRISPQAQSKVQQILKKRESTRSSRFD